MTTTVSISVIIPAYNAERYITEAIESVFAQTLLPSQVVVVDDGSTDATGEIARSYGNRVDVYSRANGGIGAARNTALGHLNGDLIAFLDADDVWPARRLEFLVRRLGIDPLLDAVFGRVVEFGEGREDGEAQDGPLASAMLIRSASFQRVGPFREDIRVGEYIDWYARAKDVGLKFAHIPEVVLRRRLHETNTGRLQRDSRSDYARVLLEALRRRREEGQTHG